MLTFSHPEAYGDIKAACEWMEVHGIKFQNGRIGQYLNDSRIVAENTLAGTTEEMREKYGDKKLTSSLIEAHEIVGIWRGLKNSIDPQLPTQLATLVAGGTMLVDETDSNNAPRNHAFHLYFQAMLARAGYKFGTHATCDIVLDIGREIMIECKRPFGEPGVEKGLSKGKKQLARHYEEDPSRAGIIAMSLTRIPCPDEDWVMTASSEEEIKEKTNARLKKVYDRYADMVLTVASPKTIGVIAYIMTPVYYQQKLIINSGIMFDPLHGIADPAFIEMRDRLAVVEDL